MGNRESLEDYLGRWSKGDPSRADIAATVRALAAASLDISNLVAKGALAGSLGAATGKKGAADEQKEIDLLANNVILEALRAAPVAAMASEEMDDPVALDETATLLVAVDPLDGSSNVEANLSIGVIFTLLPTQKGQTGLAAFLQPGCEQVAAGFVLMGPQTSLVLTLNEGTQIFTYDGNGERFVLTHPKVEIPPTTSEYAINASNYRHWEAPIRTYIKDCAAGKEGPRATDFNMRWTGSPVAEIYRILSRGGIYLYPGDRRTSFRTGRIRLIYEANPLALLIEQAGGRASTGVERVLDVVPKELHQRIPLIAGSAGEVELVDRLHSRPPSLVYRSPLFGRRGLFRT
jgi:fructose-1,6-bisphosphatase I